MPFRTTASIKQETPHPQIRVGEHTLQAHYLVEDSNFGHNQLRTEMQNKDMILYQLESILRVNR